MMSVSRMAKLGTYLLGATLAGSVAASEFQAQLRFDPIDIRNVETPATGVKNIVLSVLQATSSSMTVRELDGGTGVLFGTSVAPTDNKPHVFGYSIFQAADGSRIYLHFEGLPARAAEDKVGRGTWSVIRATGTFEGATGGGDYTFIVTKDGPVQTFNGDLSRP